MNNKVENTKNLEKESEYKISFWKDGREIYEEEVDYEELYKVLRRYNCMRDARDLING